MCRESHCDGRVLGFRTHQSFPEERDTAYIIPGLSDVAVRQEPHITIEHLLHAGCVCLKEENSIYYSLAISYKYTMYLDCFHT